MQLINPEDYKFRFPHNTIHPTAIIYNNVHMGKGNMIGAYTVIGAPGEIRTTYPEINGRIIIGSDNVITEHVTIHASGTGGTNVIGDNCFIMTKVHIGHDAIIGNNVTLSAQCLVGGHVRVGDWVNMGVQSGSHQRSIIKRGCMVGQNSMIKGETIPYGVYVGNIAHCIKFNEYAAKKEGNLEKAEEIFKEAYDNLWKRF